MKPHLRVSGAPKKIYLPDIGDRYPCNFYPKCSSVFSHLMELYEHRIYHEELAKNYPESGYILGDQKYSHSAFSSFLFHGYPIYRNGFRCLKCDHTFDDYHLLKRHVNNHHPLFQWKCRSCDAIFNDRKVRKHHWDAIHKVESNKERFFM